MLRVLEGRASHEDLDVLSHWLDASPDNKKHFDEVNATYQASVTLNRAGYQRTEEAWNELTNRLEPPAQSKTSQLTWVLRIAASVIVLALASYGIYRMAEPGPSALQTSLVKNSTGRNTRIVLPDSSVVYLNTNSTLEYPSSFGATSRNVTLHGEGFFEVRKGTKPFIVNAEELTITVKGTRFNVRAYKNDLQTKATLEEGSIELKVAGQNKIYQLVPGDQVTLDADRKQVKTSKVDPANFTAWKEDILTFDNALLGDVIYKIENRFQVHIELDSSVSASERMTMTISDESFEDVLELIQLSSGFKVRREINDFILYQ
ncbi:FecR domain-containing protein [Chryseolinea sp. T2]|uniref:FecR family protein n=1 Tax=Chryseolinea sp. T2 TaxID=3129255 RepID=UPI0030784A5B